MPRVVSMPIVPPPESRESLAEAETVRSALQRARQELPQSESAALDARLLLGFVLERGRAWLIAHDDVVLSTSELEFFRRLVRRRAQGEPVAYLRGRVHWLDLELEVSPAVLVPRPETETLAEHAISMGRSLHSRRVADIGTGSGALAIALARALPNASVEAVDVSPEALAVAGRNIARYGLTSRISLHEGHLLARLSTPPDLLVANLPYLSDEMMNSLDQDVRHEPSLALHGGVSGLELYSELFDQLGQRGWLCGVVMEIDPRQSTAMAELIASLPAGHSGTERDLSGRERIAWYLPHE